MTNTTETTTLYKDSNGFIFASTLELPDEVYQANVDKNEVGRILFHLEVTTENSKKYRLESKSN